MRVVVTGATGNVGSALLRRLTETGEHRVTGLARRPPTAEGEVGSSASWISVDLARPEAEPVLEADAVVHLAWGFQPSHVERYLAELGIGGSRRGLEAAAVAAVPRVLHMSSIGAYSPRRSLDPVDESHPTEGIARSPYSRHKVGAERLLDAFEAAHPGVVVTRMRPGIIGQRRAASSLLRYGLPAVVPAAVVAMVPLLPLDRGLKIPMVHADDVPMLSIDRAVRQLGWRPTRPAAAVLAEVLDGMVSAEHGSTEVLRPRTIASGLRDAVRRGPVAHRHRT